MLILCHINPRKCMGNQRCVSAASHLFELGEAGYSRVKRVNEMDFAETDLPLLLLARDNCPTGAITIETMADEDMAVASGEDGAS